MANSTQLVVSDGALQYLDIAFEFLDAADISVFFDSVITTDWAWVGPARVEFTPVVPNGVEVLVARQTPATRVRHLLTRGAAFTAQTMDENFMQILQLAQEAAEQNFTTDFFASMDMHGFRVRNIGGAVDDTDALTLGQYKADAQGAWQARLDAEGFKSTAVGAASTATTKAGEADASAIAAALSKGDAEQAAQAAVVALNTLDAIWLGALAVDPGVYPAGTLYFRTTTPAVLRVSTGSSWVDAPQGPQGPQGPPGDMSGVNNLSELTDVAAAKTNLNLALVATTGDFNDLINIKPGVPSGAIMDFAGTSAPAGWLMCYGQTENISTYPDLFAVIGTTFGGDGVTTFGIPDCRDRTSVGKGDMGGTAANRITVGGAGIDSTVLGAVGGGETHTLTVSEMPSHSHSFSGRRGSNSYTSPGSGAASISTEVTDLKGGSGAHPNVQPSIVLNKIIKV